MYERRRGNSCFLGGGKGGGKKGVDDHYVDSLSVQFGRYVVGQA
jgi:hypothetical protein